MPLIRAWLFVPGDSEAKMAKGRGGDADALIIDLEDSVADARQDIARKLANQFLKDNPDRSKQQLWVRINPLDHPFALADLSAVGAIGSAVGLRLSPTRGAFGRAIPWSNDQATDSVYRLARERMNRGQYKQAAELFMEVARRVGNKPLAGDALYWNAYSLYRDGGSAALRDALASLDRLSRDFPSAASIGDASARATKSRGIASSQAKQPRPYAGGGKSASSRSSVANPDANVAGDQFGNGSGNQTLARSRSIAAKEPSRRKFCPNVTGSPGASRPRQSPGPAVKRKLSGPQPISASPPQARPSAIRT